MVSEPGRPSWASPWSPLTFIHCHTHTSFTLVHVHSRMSLWEAVGDGGGLDCADYRLRGEAAVQRNKWAFAAVKPALAPRCALTIGYAISGRCLVLGARARFSRAVAISHPSTLGPGGVQGLPSCERGSGPLTAPFCLLRKQSRHGISLGARTPSPPFAVVIRDCW